MQDRRGRQRAPGARRRPGQLDAIPPARTLRPAHHVPRRARVERKAVDRIRADHVHGGIDAPICQDGRSGGFTELLARAEVSHDALIDFPSEKAFKASDDVPFRPSIRPASDDIVDRRLVIAHTDHDGSMEGGVRLSVAPR